MSSEPARTISQLGLSDAEYAGKSKKTRRYVFLEAIERVVTWKLPLDVNSPHNAVAGRGRRPYPLDSILRVHLMQNWFALSDPAMEEACTGSHPCECSGD